MIANKQYSEYLELSARFPHLSHLVAPPRKSSPKKSIEFDAQMCGVIKRFGDEDQFELIFKKNGKYYIEFATHSIYVGNYNNRESIFKFFKIYDKYLELSCCFDDIQMALAQYFPFKNIY